MPLDSSNTNTIMAKTFISIITQNSSLPLIVGVNTLPEKFKFDTTTSWNDLMLQDNDSLALAFEYCEESDIWKFIMTRCEKPTDIAFIEPCNDSEIIIFNNIDKYCQYYWKTNKINVLSIKNFYSYINETEERKYKAVFTHPWFITYINEPNLILIRRVVEENGEYIRLIHEQTPDLCLESIRQNPFNLQYIKPEYQSEFICLTAITAEPFALEYVCNQTHCCCMIAVRKNGHAIQFVKEQTIELCRVAFQQDFNCLKHMNRSMRSHFTKRWNPSLRIYELFENDIQI